MVITSIMQKKKWRHMQQYNVNNPNNNNNIKLNKNQEALCLLLCSISSLWKSYKCHFSFVFYYIQIYANDFGTKFI